MADQEPSIEEILASIREIISDDDAKPAPAEEASSPVAMEAEPEKEIEAAPFVAAQDEPAVSDDDDILDLSAFADAPVMPSPSKVPSEKRDPLEGIDLDKPKEMTVAFTEPEPVVEKPAPAPMPAPTPAPEPVREPLPEPKPMSATPETILTDHAKSASIDSLSRLAHNIAISRSGNGATLEDIVREMLRPMLRDWLDRNLPPMIERMVERELERLVKQAMDR